MTGMIVSFLVATLILHVAVRIFALALLFGLEALFGQPNASSDGS